MLQRFCSYRDELSIIKGVLSKGERVIIQETLTSTILRELHQTHMGMEKTKLRARTSIFWPGISHDLEDVVKSYNACLPHIHLNKRSR